MFAGLIAALALGISGDPARIQTPPAAVSQDPTPLEEIVVQGTLEERIEAFVEEVAAPPKGRFLAGWYSRLCPGVVNLENTAAQAILDRISTVAEEMNLQTGDPGCRANVVIIFTDDGAGLATALVERDRDIFEHRNLGAFNRDSRALEAFASSDAPVRWWHLSMPIDPRTGQRTIITAQDLLPTQYVAAEGLLGVSTIDVLYKVIIIVDVDRLNGVNLAQLSDYLAMVTLAQIDPAASVEGDHTVLNLFQRPQGVAGLTEWDRSYLAAVYTSRSRARNPHARVSDVVRGMFRDQNRPPEPPAAPEAGE